MDFLDLKKCLNLDPIVTSKLKSNIRGETGPGFTLNPETIQKKD